jgi:hypothetical protein
VVRKRASTAAMSSCGTGFSAGSRARQRWRSPPAPAGAPGPSAIASISTRMPRSPHATMVRAGNGAVKCCR